MKPLKSEDPAMQGEGNYIAARRHRRSLAALLQHGHVRVLARRAAPRDDAEAERLKQAERRSKARR